MPLCESNLRKNVIITLPYKLVRQARQKGLCISKIAESALIGAITRLSSDNAVEVAGPAGD